MKAEKIKALRQLEWMKTHLPPIPGKTVVVVAKRRRVLIGVLKRISIDGDGCMIYGSPDVPHYPRIHWPNDPVWQESPDRRQGSGKGEFGGICKWPTGCVNQRAERRASGKWPFYCGQMVDGVQHDQYQARLLRGRLEKERNHVGTRDVILSKLLFELYYPGKPPVMLTSKCGKRRCIHPGHRTTVFLERTGRERQWTTEQVREVVRLRASFMSPEDIIARYPGMSVSFVNNLYGGFDRHEETADIPRTNLREKLPRDLVRAIVEARQETGLSHPKLAEKFGLSTRTVTKILRGETYIQYTADLLEGCQGDGDV